MSNKGYNKVPLGDVLKEVYRYPTYYGIDYTAQGVLEIRGEFLNSNGSISVVNPRYISNETNSRFPKTQLEKDDIVMSVRGTLGKVGIITDDLAGANITANLLRLSPDKDLISGKYLLYYFLSSAFNNSLENASESTTIKTIKVPELKSIKIPLPSLREQRKIAEILSSVDAAIEKTEQVIAKTEEVKKGLMQQLLTKGIGHTEFKQTELGEIPVEWEVVKFNDICKNITDKFDPKIEEVKTYIALEHIEQTTGKLLGTDISTSSTSLKTQFKKDDVLFGKLRPYLRKYVYADFEGVCATEILVLRSKDICYSKYLFLLVQEENFLEFIASRTFGTKMPRTSWNEIKEYSIPLPQLQEQYEVVKIVGHLSKKLESESIKLDKLKDIKSGLMQQLLTGQVRVKID